MLTKNDLQQIKGIVKEEVEPIKIAVKAVDKKLDKVQEDIAEYLNTLEPRITNVEGRMSNIEEHLDLPKSQ